MALESQNGLSEKVKERFQILFCQFSTKKISTDKSCDENIQTFSITQNGRFYDMPDDILY